MSGLGRMYLVAYNGIQFLGWSYLLAQVMVHLAGGGAVADLYSQVATILQVVIFTFLFTVTTDPVWD
jgi:hypothetical protein